MANIYKLFMQSFSNILIYKRLEYKYRNKNKNFIDKFLLATSSSFISLLFSYPYEVAHTKMCADMTRFGHNKIYPSVLDTLKLSVQEESNIYNLI